MICRSIADGSFIRFGWFEKCNFPTPATYRSLSNSARPLYRPHSDGILPFIYLVSQLIADWSNDLFILPGMILKPSSILRNVYCASSESIHYRYAQFLIYPCSRFHASLSRKMAYTAETRIGLCTHRIF